MRAVAPLPPLQRLPRSRGRLRILDLDSECRPDAYLGSDITTRSLTGIAARFVGQSDTWCRVITADGSHHDQAVEMLTEFRSLYAEADIVTGHNLMRHDLPIISASCIYYGLPPLPSRSASDTLLHIPRAGLVFSRSQENLGELFDILEDKYHMNNHRWKRANALEDSELTRERVVSDVSMHLSLRAALIRRGLLGRASRWSPGGGRGAAA